MMTLQNYRAVLTVIAAAFVALLVDSGAVYVFR